MKIEEQEGATVVTLTEQERAALHTVVTHTVPQKIIESAAATSEPVDLRTLQSVVMALFNGLKRW